MLGPGGKREVATMAWPLAVGMLSYTMMGLVDTLLMGRVSTPAQAGVGLATTLVFIAIAFFRGFTSGAQSVVAAADGAGDRSRVQQAASAGVLVGGLTGILAAIVVALMVAVALEPLIGDATVAGPARRYLEVRVWGLPLTMAGLGYLAGLQGLGDIKARMWVNLAGNACNALLDLVLIFGWGPIPALGERGAALATVVSAGLMAVLYGLRYRKVIGRLVLPDREIVRSALDLGFPSAMQGLLGVIAFATMNLIVARAGAAHLAATEIVLQIASVSFLPGFGVGEAGGVLVGRYLGGGKPRTAARAIRSARVLALIVMGLCGVLFATAGDQIAALFSQDPEVVQVAGRLMLFAAAFQMFDAVAMVHLTALRSAGDTRFTLAVTTISAWCITVPASLVLGLWLGWGAPGAWLGLTVEIALLAAVTGWRVAGIRRGRVGRLDLLLGNS